MTIEIILVDDHTVVREGFVHLLAGHDDLAVVGQADDGLAGVTLAERLRPDVVIMDVTMPGLDGVMATRRLAETVPEARVLGLSMHPSQRVVIDMLRAGASGYLVKSCAYEELVKAVRTVAEGRMWLSPEVAGGVVTEYLEGRAVDGSVLTDREREVVALVARGKSNREISDLLHLSQRTIEKHRQRIMTKLELDTSADLVKYAIREGLTTLD